MKRRDVIMLLGTMAPWLGGAYAKGFEALGLFSSPLCGVLGIQPGRVDEVIE